MGKILTGHCEKRAKKKTDLNKTLEARSSICPIAVLLQPYLSVPFCVDKKLDNPDCNTKNVA